LKLRRIKLKYTHKSVNVGAVGGGSFISSLAGRPCASSSRIFSKPSGCCVSK